MRITIYNRSSCVTADQFQKIIIACSQYFTSFSIDWKMEPIQIVSATYNSRDPVLDNTVYILDTTDIHGALGYHYESNGISISKIFAKTVLDYGGVVLYKDVNTFTVAQTVSHEILEMIGNGNINKWYLDNNGTFWAAEMCDAVENNLYVLTIIGNTKVGLTDYILPAWTKPDIKVGPFNKMNTLRAPFTIDRYGYSIIIRRNSVSAVYGSHISEVRREEVTKNVEELKSSFVKVDDKVDMSNIFNRIRESIKKN